MSDFVIRRSFTPAPSGLHRAVCVDAVNLGLVVHPQYGKKHMCALHFELSANMADGRPFTISRRFSVSLGKKASLRAFLTEWFGKDPGKSVDMEALVGKPAQILVVHTEKDGEVYANIKAIMPHTDAATALHQYTGPNPYIRFKNRPGYVPPTMDGEISDAEIAEKEARLEQAGMEGGVPLQGRF